MSAGSRASDLTDVCRLCLDKERLLFPVFESDGLPSKIASCLQVEIQRTDELTQKICDDCANKVDAFYEFRNKTACSQKELEKWLMETKKEERQNQVLQLRELKAAINRPKKVEEHGASPDEEDKELEEEGNEELDEENDEDFDEEYETEECMNGDEEIRDDEQWNEEAKGKDELDFGPEPTNFVNVPSLDSEEPGPSGFQPPETDSIAVPEKSIRTTVPKAKLDSPLDLRRTLNKDPPAREFSRVGFACPKCGEEFRLEKSLAKHLEAHGNVSVSRKRSNRHVCQICPYSSSSATNFKIHAMKHNNEHLAKCGDCGKGFYTMSAFREHARDKHGCEPNVHRCQVCGKDYHSGSYLRQHLKTHAPGYSPRDFQCEICGRTFHSWKGVKRHIRTVHEGSRHRCDVCGKEVACLQSLKNHKKIHSGERTFVCEACGKCFITLGSLAVHERVHTGAKPYACDLCDKSFSQRSTLKVHRRYHTGERPYQCGFCDKRFVTRALARTHEKTHSDLQKCSEILQ